MSLISSSSSRAQKKRTSPSSTSTWSLADRATWNGVRSVRRMEILEAIRANGPLTVPDLSELFKQESTGLYYHVRLLQKAGFLHAVGKDGRESFAVTQNSLRLSCNLKSAKEAKRIGKLVEGYVAASQDSFAGALTANGRGQLLRGLRWENLEASEVARIKNLQQQIASILDQAKVRRGRAKKIGQTRANWHVGCFIQPAGDDQFPVTEIECVSMG